MKSIKEKAEAYDKVLEWATEAHKVCDGMLKEDLEHLFPELKESEDERIIQYFKDLAPFDKADELYEKYGFSHKDAIFWLEKQGRHAKFINGIQVGDKVTRNEDGVLVNLSQLKRVAKPSDDIDTEKQGKNNMGISEATKKKLEDNLNKALEKETPESWNEFLDEQKPADKVEPKIKVKYACCEYDVLEVKDTAGVTYYGIEDEPNHIDYVKADNCEIISGGYGIKENGSPYPTKPAVFSEQKPAWSEEDDKMFNSALWHVKNSCGNGGKNSGEFEVYYWLKSLKDRVQPKQEWSEEDESRLDIIFERIERGLIVDKDDIDRLKSLKERYTWKPSDEQMNALNYVVNLMASSERPTENDLYYNILKSLRQQLMKLKG